MNLTLQKKSSGKATGASRRTSTSLVPAVARVNLLPSEILDKRSLRSLRRVLGLVVVGVLLLCAIASFFSWTNLSRAETDLRAEQQRTSDLLLEQRKYAEVTVVKDRIVLTRDALDYVSTTDVDWDAVIGMIAAATPDEVLLRSVTGEAATPLTAAAEPADPLMPSSIGTLRISATSDTRPDVSAWARNLEALPGVSDVRIDVTTAVLEDSDEPSYFATEVVVALSDVLQRADGRIANLPAEGEEN